MHERELEYRSAGVFAQGAAINARMRTLAMWSHYDYQQKVQAERMAMVLEDFAYSTRRVFVNPRKSFIAIKVEQPRVKDRSTLEQLERQWAAEGVTKIVTDQAVIYRIAKN